MTKFPWQGIRVRIHPLFWFMILCSVLTGHFFEILVLFVLVIIHEMGHVTAAWSFRWRMSSMELLPFGGVAKTEEWGTVPSREEMVVALAGPLQHVFIIFLSLFLHEVQFWTKEWTEYFIEANLIIAAFNLLPIYPLDGGRIVQSLFSYCFPYLTCIRYTLWLSTIFSCALFGCSFMIPGNVIHLPLFCISLFLIVSNMVALRKIRYQYMRFLIGRRDKGIPDNARIKKVRIKADDSLWVTVRGWHKEKYHLFEVTDGTGNLIGVLPEERVLERYFSNASFCRVGELVS